MTKRTARLADLRRAATIAREAGVTVTVEGPDGTVYRITPDDAPLPMGAGERECGEADKAFGL